MAEESTTVVILGGTGDLALRKLVPALFTLACKGRLPQGLRVVAFARRDYSDDRYREYMWNGTREIGGLAARRDEWEMFAGNMYYVSGDIDDPHSFVRLKHRLDGLDKGEDGTSNRLYYLSVAPRLFETAVKNIAEAGLANEDNGWRRAVIEKPFGHDLESAQKLNRAVQEVFDEHQVYRIDHYLGKETVQNLLVFRFANAIFEPIWNRNYIDNVQITVAESVSVGDRGGYYDQSGVVRDMVQNHLLQLLTLVAMEPPNVADSESLRNKKVEVLQAIRRPDRGELLRSAVRGQYEGYIGEDGVGGGGVEAGDGFVGQDHPGVLDARAGNAHPLLLAARERVGALERMAGKSEIRQEAVGGVHIRLVPEAERGAPLGALAQEAGEDVLEDREAALEVVVLEHEAYLRARPAQSGGGKRGHLLPGEHHLARRGLHEAVYTAQESALPGAARSHDRHELPLLRREVQAGEGRGRSAVIGFGEAFHLEEGGGGGGVAHSMPLALARVSKSRKSAWVVASKPSMV
ncbi:glucose-6-phosphate dehydrogenase (NADP(+)) [bacterium]|nr:glucose-6-phosphate dehydrogenase (NADP(+)) [bacterium]